MDSKDVKKKKLNKTVEQLLDNVQHLSIEKEKERVAGVSFVSFVDHGALCGSGLELSGQVWGCLMFF